MRLTHEAHRGERGVYPFVREVAAAFDDETERLFIWWDGWLPGRAKDVLGDPVANVISAVARLEVRDGISDPPRLGDEPHGQGSGKRRGKALRRIRCVRAVFE